MPRMVQGTMVCQVARREWSCLVGRVLELSQVRLVPPQKLPELQRSAKCFGIVRDR